MAPRRVGPEVRALQAAHAYGPLGPLGASLETAQSEDCICGEGMKSSNTPVRKNGSLLGSSHFLSCCISHIHNYVVYIDL